MKKETELALKQLYDKYTMIQLTLFCLTEKRAGKWLKRKGKDGTIYINTLEGVKIIEDNNGKLRVVQMSNDYSCPIEDGKIIDIINEIRPKKKVAKKPTKPTTPKDDGKWDKKTVDYVECFERICEYMRFNTGHVPSVYENEEDYDEETEVDICLDDDGMEHEYWATVRAFVGGDENAESIFDMISDLDKRYHKLTRWYAEFCNNCRPLGKVKIKDRTPAGIMKALDKAGL